MIRGFLRLEKIRKKVVIELWNKVSKEIIMKYKTMSLNYKSIAVQIGIIRLDIRNKTIENYYKMIRTKHKFALRLWLKDKERRMQEMCKEQTESKRKSISNKKLGIKQLSQVKMSIASKKEESKKLIFKYIPTTEEMTNLILSVVDNKRIKSK